jgi:hypothetical protein
MIERDVYQLEVEEDGRSRLLRFNKKYSIWVSIEFIGDSVSLEKSVQDHLKGQYIRRVLENLKNDGSC